MDTSLRRSKRCSPSSTPQLVKDSEGASLRRSTRVGRLPARYHSATTAEPLSHFSLSTSHKRKRTSSTSKERSTSREFKRSHTDISSSHNSTPAHHNHALSTSTRYQRHRRRHPSVFEEEPSEMGTSQATASTSYLRSAPIQDDSAADLTPRRIRKKENVAGKRIGIDSRISSSSIFHPPTRNFTSKGKERDPGTIPLTSDAASPPSSSPSLQKFLSLPFPVEPNGIPTHSDRPSDPQSEPSEEISDRRLRSQSLTKGTAKVPLTKRKRTSSTGAQTGKKKAKTIEPENFNDGQRADAPTPSRNAEFVTSNSFEPVTPILTTVAYPKSLPNPIPTLSVTPPTPPNSPPPVVASDLTPIPISPVPSVEEKDEASPGSNWDWPTGTQPILPMKSSALEYALSSASTLQSNDPVEASSSLDEIQRSRPLIQTSRGKRIRRVARLTEKPSETLFTLACRERVDYLRYHYLGQLQDYEADQAFEFFTRMSASSKPDASTVPSSASDQQETASTSSSATSTRPQSPTWSIVLHWENRRQDAGEWDGHIHDMHPLSPPMSPSSSANQDALDREPDFRTEDYFPFELAESDEEEEGHTDQPFVSDPPSDSGSSGLATMEEEHEDTESDSSDESEDLSSVQGASEMHLTLPAYTPTPSSLAEALTPLAPSASSPNFSTGVFALPVSHPSKKPTTFQEVPSFITRSPTPEEKDFFPPPPLSIPPPPLATIVPAQTRPHESDQLSETFQQEILPACQADRIRVSSQNDIPTTFSSTCPSVLRAEIRRRADIRLRTPHMRLLNYASRKLGSIGHGTPIDPSRRRNLIAWLEDQKIVQHSNDAQPIEEAYVQDNVERLPPLGSAAWYAMRFPSMLSSQTVLNSSVHKSNAFMISMSHAPSSPQALLAATSHHEPERQVSFDANWPPLTVQPGELEAFRNHHWMDAKAYFADEGVSSSDLMQNVEFEQGSSRGCGTDETHYQYPQADNSNHGVTPNTNGNFNHSTVALSRFSPKIAMDENLSDEDAEGDIDPDVMQPVSVTGGFTNASIAPARPGLTTVPHGNDTYNASNSVGVASFHPNQDIEFGSGASPSHSEFHSTSRMGLYGGMVGPSSNDIVGEGMPNAEILHPGSIPARSITDASPAGFPNAGIQGIGMNLNVGVSVGFGVSMGMGINRFGMDMMGVGVGLGMIGFPVVETDSWFLPASSPPSSPLPLPSTNGEHHDHGAGAIGAFGNNSIFSDSLPDHARERFGSPGSPESAYPLGFAMG